MEEVQVQSLDWEDPLEKENGNPLQYSWLGNPIDRSLEGYSPWGRKSWTRLSGYTATTPQQKLTRQCKSTGFCFNYQ